MRKIIVRNGTRLTDDDVAAIVEALRIAGEQYERDINSVKAGERGTAQARLVSAFEQQKANAMRLLAGIEDAPGGLVLDLTEDAL